MPFHWGVWNLSIWHVLYGLILHTPYIFLQLTNRDLEVLTETILLGLNLADHLKIRCYWGKDSPVNNNKLLHNKQRVTPDPVTGYLYSIHIDNKQYSFLLFVFGRGLCIISHNCLAETLNLIFKDWNMCLVWGYLFKWHFYDHDASGFKAFGSQWH